MKHNIIHLLFNIHIELTTYIYLTSLTIIQIDKYSNYLWKVSYNLKIYLILR